MFCSGCAATVERSIAAFPGVQRAAVSFVGDLAVVWFHPGGLDEAGLSRKVRRLGYELRPLDSEGSARERDAFFKKARIRLAVSAFFALWTMMASLPAYLEPALSPAWLASALSWAALILSLPVIVYAGWPFYQLGWRSLRSRAPGMETLISTAVLAAVAVSLFNLVRGEPRVYLDAAVMLVTFQLIARLTDFVVRRRAGDAVRSLMRLLPAAAHKLSENGWIDVSPRSLVRGDRIVVRAGERSPVDGCVVTGRARVDRSLVTGESLPELMSPGDVVGAGVLVLDAGLEVRVTGIDGQREIDGMAREVRAMLARKGSLAALADRIAGWLLPTLLIAALLAVGLGIGDLETGLGEAFSHGLAVLIVTCPCALSLAVPLVIARTTALASRRGMIIRDPAIIETGRDIDEIVFDKTGTLTLGQPVLTHVEVYEAWTREAILSIAAQAEYGATHPLARAIGEAAGIVPAPSRPAEQVAGYGVRITDDWGREVRVGRPDWAAPDIAIGTEGGQTCVAVVVGGSIAGMLHFSDQLRPDARAMIECLKAVGYRVSIASGDSESATRVVARELDIDHVAELSPAGKQRLIEESRERGRRVAFVGDGINDGPALASADVGIAVTRASDLALSAAAIGLVRMEATSIRDALALIRHSSAILRHGLAWAMVYNAVLLPAAIIGFIAPVMAAVAMSLSTISVLVNSLRVR